MALDALLREGLPPEHPALLRLIAGVGWRMERRMKPAFALLVEEELQRTFGLSPNAAGALAREALDTRLQYRIEELVLPRLGGVPASWCRLEGRWQEGAVGVCLHTGNLTVLYAALGAQLGGVGVLGGEPLAPPGGATPLHQWAEARRVEAERALPFVHLPSLAAAQRWVGEGRPLVVVADGRCLAGLSRVPFLGREAWLGRSVWAWLEAEGLPVSPLEVWRGRDKRHRICVQPAVAPSLEGWLQARAEPFLRRHPGHYAAWLAACAVQAGEGRQGLFPPDSSFSMDRIASSG